MESLGDLVGELLGWLGDLLGPFWEDRVQRQADHALAKGSVECSLKVISGRQQGLSSRWRRGVAAISPGRLDFTSEWWSLKATGPVTHIAVLGPARLPSVEELTWLPGDCRVTELQTPTATLGWAVPVRDLARALEHLQDLPVEGSTEAQPETYGGAGNEPGFPQRPPDLKTGSAVRQAVPGH